MSVPATETVTMGPWGTVTPTPTTGSTSSTSASGLGSTAKSSSDDKELFMQLLVAQLRYQDPMNPADSSEFLSQTAQFNALEKMQDVADQTGALLGAQMAFGASGLVGQQVSYTLADGTPGSGSVSGVTFTSLGPVLDVAGTDVPMASVTSVTAATAATAATGGAGTTTTG